MADFNTIEYDLLIIRLGELSFWKPTNTYKMADCMLRVTLRDHTLHTTSLQYNCPSIYCVRRRTNDHYSNCCLRLSNCLSHTNWCGAINGAARDACLQHDAIQVPGNFLRKLYWRSKIGPPCMLCYSIRQHRTCIGLKTKCALILRVNCEVHQICGAVPKSPVCEKGKGRG